MLRLLALGLLFISSGCTGPRGPSLPTTASSIRRVSCPVGEPDAPAADGKKRFELRLGQGLFAERMSVSGIGTLEKAAGSQAVVCASVDLSPGKWRVRYHADGDEQGMFPSFAIREYAAAHRSWYDTFDFSCGDPACASWQLDEWYARAGRVERGLFDPCGSARVVKLRHRSLNKMERVTSLDVEFELEISALGPKWPHGAAECGSRGK